VRPIEFLTVEEAAERLGVSVATVRRRAAAGELPARKSGKQWLIEGDELPATRSRARRSLTTPSVDLSLALQHVRATDLAQVWVPDVLRFEDYLRESTEVLAIAADRLQHGPPEPAIEVDVAKTPFFTRSAVLLSLEDRVAYQAAVASIAPAIEASLPPEVFSARLSPDPKWFLQKGPTLWRKWHTAVRREIENGSGWMIKTDLTAYFDHIPHQLLMEEISSLNPDPRIAEALRRMLKAWALVPGMGVPQGPNASRVLGNLYLLPVDRAMLAGGYKYYRYLDDVRIVGRTKAEVVAGMRLFEKECRRRGLIASAGKTQLLEGSAALNDDDHPDRDRAHYLFEANRLPKARTELKKILRSALQSDGHIDVAGAKFSLWRLARIREHTMLRTILDRLEDLAPVASVVAAYLKHFITRDRVVKGLDGFFADSTRSHSTYLVTWLFAAMLERSGILPDEWTRHAARYVKDRNQPVYLRVIAGCVFARSGRPADVAWLKAEIAREYDPVLLRGFAVALMWGRSLDKATTRTLSARSAIAARTLRYLAGRQTLPSLIYGDVSLRL
jgi:excisionase family DNA binding protein